MSREERAKQFMPFAALKGFEKVLQEMERVTVPKIELSEEAAEELGQKLLQVRKNEMLTAVYYNDGEYQKLTGLVSRIDLAEKVLKIVNTNIPFSELYAIDKES
ncbi:MAG: YolD-like family protein [Lachnospiraceae bacterium]|nr:YolD-like family protein [Lachnospiraceae bacterium]